MNTRISQLHKQVKTAVCLLVCGLLAACDQGPSVQTQVASFVSAWLNPANPDASQLCHGLGMLKDKQFECDDYLAAAQGIDPASRAIQEIRELECFEKVCGEFFEVRVTGTDNYGEHSEETVLLKRDDGVLKVYWYRSKLMLADIRRENERIEEASQSPMQVAYGRLTEKYPALYQYPPCPDDLRASSSTLQGTPQREDELQSAAFEEWAQQCPDTFCLAMVGTKIAGLCP